MMTTEKLNNLLETWLQAERKADDREAERQLSNFLQQLPSTAGPSPVFAQRVLEQLVHVQPLQRPRFAAPRTLIVGGLLGMCLAIWLLPATLRLIGTMSAASWLSLPVNFLASSIAWLKSLLEFADVASTLVNASYLVVSSVPIMSTLVGLTTISLLAFRALTSLLTVERRPSHASS